MRYRNSKTISRLLCGSAALALSWGGLAQAEERAFDIQAQPLSTALMAFGAQSGHAVMAPMDLMEAKVSRGFQAPAEPEVALVQLLEGTGLTYTRDGDTFAIVEGGSAAPQSGSAAGDGAEVEALIVTAQKREEDIQDVPIAISAFTAKDLEQQKIEGGFDLLKAIPNVTFSKNNFTSYNFSIRGIGTKAVSATTDPGVAVSFNNIALIQNRLFEQEYFDVERVEVLRGPQGTLYGRNATAGVINVISAKPDLNDFDGWIKGEVGNHDSKRLSAMINVPLVEDRLALRFAGAMTDRQGYDYNEVTKNHINGRDLWSARLTLGFEPIERLRGNLIWERFEEDDDRSRTGKQLCHRDPGLAMVGNTSTETDEEFGGGDGSLLRAALFSQGCRPGSLYDDAAFGTPNGLALPFVFSTLALQLGGQWPLGRTQDGEIASLLDMSDPYGNMMQSRDLRTIASFKDPVYRAKADVVELNIDFDLTDSLTLTSQTAYNKDEVYSFQDFNRFNTVPIFNDTSTFRNPFNSSQPSAFAQLAPGGIFCDPQLGCSDTMAGFDISQAKAEQFTQELRLQSDFEGPINFSIGANYTRFNVLIDYYVMFNLLTATALVTPFNGGTGNPTSDIALCGWIGPLLSAATLDIDDPTGICPYIDPNPVESINGEGHNYFRSKNPYRLKAAAAFGELYWNLTPQVKITAGVRYNDDRKIFTPVPSQVLLAKGLFAGGAVNRGYPEDAPIEQNWKEWTGRLGVDWTPDLSFTDDTMLYAFYSRGYKGGGANPPLPGFADLQYYVDLLNLPPAAVDFYVENGVFPVLRLTGQEYEPVFRPEFVNAVEIGSKNTLLQGALTLNAAAFYYDYTDYQVSQIRDRTAVNENFDAKAWGLELQALFAPSRDLQFIANIGYLDTEIGDGMKSINIMDRTQGHEDWVLVKPWMQLPSNCVVPVSVVEDWLQANGFLQSYWSLCGGYGGVLAVPPLWDPDDYPEINGGAGFHEDVSGNELPNSPHWTANLGAQYGWDILEDWRMTVRGDAYWQSQSWARVYNDNPYDKLHGWYNVNLSVWFERPDDDLKIEFYVKNALDKTPITDAFLNSDDTALTTNVFVLDPRLIGLSIRKGF